MIVLIAEDDSISRRMLEAFLVKWGYEVVWPRKVKRLGASCKGTMPRGWRSSIG